MRRQEHTQKKRCKVNFMRSPLYRNGIVIIWFFALESHANCLWIGFDCTPICQCRMHFSEQLFARMLAIMTPDQRFTCKHALSKSHRSERTRQSKCIAQFGWLVFFGIIADSLTQYRFTMFSRNIVMILKIDFAVFTYMECVGCACALFAWYSSI